MYAEENLTDITKENFEKVATLSHVVALDHYPEGPRSCKQTKQTMGALSNAAVSIIAECACGLSTRETQLNELL
jgi:hypothetical protein